MKKILIAVLVLLFGAIFTSTYFAEENKKIELSLEDAFKMAEQNREVVLLDKQIVIYERQYKESLGYQQTAKGKQSSDMEEDLKRDLLLNPKKALYTYENAKKEREDKVKEVKAEIFKRYQNLLVIKGDIDNLNVEMENLNKQIDMVNKKIQMGLLKATDVKQYESSKAKLEASINSKQREYDMALIELKNYLGIDKDAEVVLTSKPAEFVKFDETNLEERISKAIEGSYDIEKAKKDLELLKIEYDIERDYSTTDANNLEIQVENKQYEIDNLPRNIETNIRTAYNNLKNLEDSIEIEKLNLEVQQINLKTAEANYKAGKIGYIDVLSARLNFAKQEAAVQSAINEYMKASYDFRSLLGE